MSDANIPDEWSELDVAARANLREDISLLRFFEYKEELKRDGHSWANDARDILAGFIWGEIEYDASGEED